MSGTSIDHLVSVAVLLAAVLLFIGLFNQTLSTAVTYQRQSITAKKCSDLLDTILLTPGIPTTGAPTTFGLQDPQSSQYQLNPFALMRLNSSSGAIVSYQKTGLTYSNITAGSNNFLLTPSTDVINYSTALALLGINGTYGFQLTLTPTITFSIAEVSTSPVTLSVSVTGVGFPLANAPVSYSFIPVLLNGTFPDFETLVSNQTGTVYTNGAGHAPQMQFPLSLNQNLTYVFLVCAHLDGVTGVGYYEHASTGNQQVIPFLDTLSSQRVLLANSADVPTNASTSNSLSYNTTFVLTNQNYALQETQLGSANQYGYVSSGPTYASVPVSFGSYTPGILVIAYNQTGNNGIVMMPWGLGALGFQLTFGGNRINQGWVSTDLRQVQINGVSYQAKLSLWSTQGYQVISK